MERVKACPDTAAVPCAARGRPPSGRIREGLACPSPGALADPLVVAVKLARIAAWVEPRGGVVQANGCGQPQGMSRVREPKLKGKSYVIPKRLLWDAWLKVKENGGAAGADGVTIEQYGQDLSGNLFKLWNRMSSGSYFPGPVRAVEIPKKGKQGGVRVSASRTSQTGSPKRRRRCRWSPAWS